MLKVSAFYLEKKIFLKSRCQYQNKKAFFREVLVLIRKIALHYNLVILTLKAKGQLISKANCQAVNSPKKRMNEFVFPTM